MNDNRAEYDIEFVVGNEEYDYDIDAVTGEILSMDRDIDHYNFVIAGCPSQAPVTSGKKKLLGEIRLSIIYLK